ncbi:MAG TPA: DUF2723 domain-containing protein [Dongiaceae bacterium]|nr:DUF2723 domain-containing protein [Dongiaceae bacterium]
MTPRAWAVVVSTVAALALDLPTMSHGIGFVDQGELAAVAATLGIAHPTGYPWLTLIAHAWVEVVPLTPIVALDLLAALLTAASAGALAWLYDSVLASWLVRPGRTGGPRRPKRAKAPGPASEPALGDHARALAATCAALATAWTGTWWDQATGFEVYALHALMLPLVTALFLRYVATGRGGPLFAYALGLAFSNHLTTVLLAPAFLVLYALERRVTRRSFAALVPLAPWFVLGLTPYLYLPLRSACAPRFDWGAPHTLHAWFEHVTGWQFRVWMFSEPGAFALQSRYFFTRLPGELAWIGLGIAAIGLLVMLRRAPRLALAVLLMFATSIVYAGGFAIAEIRPYYLTAFLALGIAIAAGLGWVGGRFGTRALAVTGLTLAALVALANYRASDAHDERSVADMAHDLLEPLPPGAVVLSSEWDLWLAGSFYLQEVAHLRPDVTVVDLELLRRRWYLDELARRAPGLASRVREPLERFRTEVTPFETGRPYDSARVEDAYRGLIAAIAHVSSRDRAVFVTPEIDPDETPGFRRVPWGLVERLTADTAYVPGPALAWRQRTRLTHLDPYSITTAARYARAATERAFYESAYGRDSLADQALAIARGFDPKLRAEAFPTPPYRGREQIAAALDFFDRLRTLDRGTLRRAAGRLP